MHVGQCVDGFITFTCNCWSWLVSDLLQIVSADLVLITSQAVVFYESPCAAPYWTSNCTSLRSPKIGLLVNSDVTPAVLGLWARTYRLSILHAPYQTDDNRRWTTDASAVTIAVVNICTISQKFVKPQDNSWWESSMALTTSNGASECSWNLKLPNPVFNSRSLSRPMWQRGTSGV